MHDPKDLQAAAASNATGGSFGVQGQASNAKPKTRPGYPGQTAQAAPGSKPQSPKQASAPTVPEPKAQAPIIYHHGKYLLCVRNDFLLQFIFTRDN